MSTSSFAPPPPQAPVKSLGLPDVPGKTIPAPKNSKGKLLCPGCRGNNFHHKPGLAGSKDIECTRCGAEWIFFPRLKVLIAVNDTAKRAALHPKAPKMPKKRGRA